MKKIVSAIVFLAVVIFASSTFARIDGVRSFATNGNGQAVAIEGDNTQVDSVIKDMEATGKWKKINWAKSPVVATIHCDENDTHVDFTGIDEFRVSVVISDSSWPNWLDRYLRAPKHRHK